MSSQVPRLLPVLYWPLGQLPTQDPGIWSPRLHLPGLPQGLRSPVLPTHYLSCPNPLFPPPASPCVPVHPTASPPPSLLASTLLLWEEVGDRKEGCHANPLAPGEGVPQVLSPPSLLKPCTHLTSLCPPGTQFQDPSLQVLLAPHLLEGSFWFLAAPPETGLGWGHQPGKDNGARMKWRASSRAPRLQEPFISSP